MICSYCTSKMEVYHPLVYQRKGDKGELAEHRGILFTRCTVCGHLEGNESRKCGKTLDFTDTVGTAHSTGENVGT